MIRIKKQAKKERDDYPAPAASPSRSPIGQDATSIGLLMQEQDRLGKETRWSPKLRAFSLKVGVPTRTLSKGDRA